MHCMRGSKIYDMIKLRRIKVIISEIRLIFLPVTRAKRPESKRPSRAAAIVETRHPIHRQGAQQRVTTFYFELSGFPVV